MKTFRLIPSHWSAIAIATFGLLAVGILFGGASRLHELRLALVELAALPLLVTGLLALISGKVQPSRLALSIIAFVVALPLAQLVPVPPAIWTNLPGREQLSLALDLVNTAPGWLPISLTPDKTWRSLLALIPPVAMFFGIQGLRPETRLKVVFCLLIAAVGAILLGAIQLASGGDQLYLWPTTDAGSVVGFFANRNHLATFCLVAMPFVGALIGRAQRRGTAKDRLAMWMSIGLLALLIVALGVIRSRAGIVLAAPALVGSLAVAWAASDRGTPKLLLTGIVGVTGVAITAVAVFALGPIMSRFDPNGAPEGRFENWPTVLEAANAYLPLGSGIGSFDAVYRSVEPLERLDATFFNQAHNEYLETWLEAGWPGAAILVVFLIWAARRAWSAWRSGPSTERDLQRAATVSVFVMLAHSAADYPLRTATMAIVFAFCCSLMDLAGQTPQSPGPRRRVRTRV